MSSKLRSIGFLACTIFIFTGCNDNEEIPEDNIINLDAYAENIIAFTSDRDGNNEIYLMNADGTGQTRITNNRSTD